MRAPIEKNKGLPRRNNKIAIIIPTTKPAIIKFLVFFLTSSFSLISSSVSLISIGFFLVSFKTTLTSFFKFIFLVY